MEDDIDIEEHDVLEHPRIRTIFPDLAQIKQEIPDDDYHDPDQQMEYRPYPEDEDNPTQDAAEYTRLGSKIILGSKPTSNKVNEKAKNDNSVPIFGRKSIQIKQEVGEEEETVEEIHHGEELEESYHQSSSVMILGSRPSNSGVIEPINTEHVNTKTTFFDPEIDLNSVTDGFDKIDEKNDQKDPTTAFVLVENWGPRLDCSSCYCKECEILFPTRNTLLSHNMTAHSFLVAVDKNKAKKSTAKPTEKNVSNSSGKFCNHCNKMFPDSDSLINHLYEKLTFDKSNAVFKPQPKKIVANPSNLEKKQVSLPKASTSAKVDEEYGLKVEVYFQGAIDLFRCEICSYYHEIYGCFLKHMMTNHGKTKFNKKKVNFDGSCLLCNSTFQKKMYYNRHIKLKHLDMYNLKESFPKAQVAKRNVPKKQQNKFNLKPKNTNQFTLYKQYNGHKFQCQKCSEILLSYQDARKHRQFKHPESATQAIFKKITNVNNKTVCIQKARVPAKVVLKYPKNTHKGQNSSQTVPFVMAIPKSILFKCNKCQIHFTSCTASVLHSKTCTRQKGEWKCEICSREFQDFDKTVHMRQHQISKKFNVIVYSDNIYGRVLNKCPKCNIYFHEKEFYIHEQKSICRGTGVKCEHCSFPIHSSSTESHSKWHDRIQFSKNNIIAIEYSNSTAENKAITPVKRALDSSQNNTPAKKAKVDEDFNPTTKVMYCETCGVYLFNMDRRAKHRNGNCKDDPRIQKKLVCKFCGLIYTSHSHINYHRDHPEITLMDMKFITVRGQKVIAPPIPNFPQCNECEVQFGKQDTVITHNCKYSYKTCEYCHKKFSDLAYKLHIRFHEYDAKFRGSTSNDHPKVSKCPTSVQKPKLKVPLPELLQKYEKLTNTWNILFLCDTCDIVCDSYDKAVEHCQKHYNNLESYDVTVQNCDICELNFDGTCYEKHAELHAQNKSITKDSFKILLYKYYHLFKISWTRQFKELPESQLEQIISRSIYRYGRSVKMRVVQQGAPENTVYRCGQCKTYVHPHSLTNHFKNVSCRNSIVYKCSYCSIPFSTMPARVQHEKMHETAKTFRVVYFNESGDEEFNAKLRKNDETKTLGPTVAGVGKAYHYYKCVSCKVCIGRREKAVLHKCCHKLVVRCNVCQLHFNKKLLSRHLKLHELNTRLVRKNIKCTPFKNKKGGEFEILEEEEKVVIKLYKCQCGLHFTSTKAAEKHLEVCSTDVDIAKEKCSKCSRLFDTTQLVTHLCKHHSKDDKPTEFEVTTLTPHNKARTQEPIKTPLSKHQVTSDVLKRKSLYKCCQCDVYYLSPSGLIYHFEINHELSKVRPCPHCKLNFMPMTLRKHIKVQHQILQCEINDFIIHIGNYQKDGRLVLENVPKFSETQPKLVKNNPSEAQPKLIKQDPSEVQPKLIKESLVLQDKHQDIDVSAYSENLYKCEVCNAHFLTAKTAQTHKYKTGTLKSQKSKLFSCPDCDYSFRACSLSRHEYIHHQKMKLRREDFKINCSFPCKIDQESLNDSQGSVANTEDEDASSIGDTISLNKTEDTDAVEVVSDEDQTVEVEERSADEKEIVKTFKYSSILFKCGFCDWISFTDNIDYHIKSHSEGKPAINVFTCFCGLSFCRSNLLRHEMLHHEKEDLSRDDIYVITLSQHGDFVSSKHIFRCDICQVYFIKLSALKNHLSYVEHNTQTKDCSQCGLVFSRGAFSNHVKIHHEIMKLKREDFAVIESVGKNRVKIVELGDDFKEKTELMKIGENDAGGLIQSDSKYKAALHKCGSCGTHYLTASAFGSHQNACPLETEFKATCEECQLQFSKHNLDIHMEEHHKNMHLKPEDFEIVQYGSDENVVKNNTEEKDAKDTEPGAPKDTLSKTDIENIVSSKKENVEQEDCQLDSVMSEASDDIALIYENDVETDRAIVEESKCIELSDNGPESDDINTAAEKKSTAISTVTRDSLDKGGTSEHKNSEAAQTSSNAKKDSENVIKLYKCAVCNVCFLSQVFCYKHATKHVTLDPKDYIECKLCGYQFLILNNCLHKHITKHHKKAFKPEDVLIEEYHPDILCHGTPKINIYFGTDKLQSKLISTTSEAISSDVLEGNDIDAKTDDISSISMDSDKSVNMDDSALES